MIRLLEPLFYAFFFCLELLHVINLLKVFHDSYSFECFNIIKTLVLQLLVVKLCSTFFCRL